MCVHPGTLLGSEQEVLVSALKRQRRQETVSINLGQCGKCYHSGLEKKDQERRGNHGELPGGEDFELRFEDSEKEGLACILGNGFSSYILMWQCHVNICLPSY